MKEQTEPLLLDDLLKECKSLNRARDRRVLELARYAQEVAVQANHREAELAAMYETALAISSIEGSYRDSNQICAQLLASIIPSTDTFLQASVCRLMGTNYYYLGHYTEAGDCYHRAIERLQTLSGELPEANREMADLYYNISILYKQPEQLPLRYQYICRAEDIYRSMDYKPGIAKSLMGLGNYNATLNRTEVANGYYFEAAALYEEANDIAGLSIVYNNLGSNFADLQQYHKAEEYHQRSLSIKMQIGNPNLIGVSHLHISESLMKQHKKEEAIAHLLLAEEYLEKFNNRSDLISVYGYLRDLNEEKGDFEKAYRYSNKFYETREALHSFEKQSALAAAQSKFELEQKEKEADLLKTKNAEIEEANRRLKRSNKELRQYAHVASHDLKEPLRMVSVYMDLLRNRIKGKLSEEESQFLEYAIDGSKRMQTLIQDLLELSKISAADKYEPVDMNECLRDVMKTLKHELESRNVKISIQPLPNILFRKTSVQQLLQNLICNGIKYNESEVPEINIGFLRKKGYLHFTVSDNGIGIPEQYREKIFEIFQRLHTREKYTGTGIGLAICKKIVDQLNGEITVQSNASGGSDFCFRFPEQVEIKD